MLVTAVTYQLLRHHSILAAFMRRPVDASLVALQMFLTVDFSYFNTPSCDPSTSIYILGVKSVHTQSRSFGTRFRTFLDDSSSSRFLFYLFIYFLKLAPVALRPSCSLFVYIFLQPGRSGLFVMHWVRGFTTRQKQSRRSRFLLIATATR